MTVNDKSEFVEPINNLQCTIYNHADVAIQAVFCKSLYIVNCKLFIGRPRQITVLCIFYIIINIFFTYITKENNILLLKLLAICDILLMNNSGFLYAYKKTT